MLKKTSSLEFKKYGGVYDDTIHENHTDYVTRELIPSGQTITHMYHFNCPFYIELLDGIADILIGDDLQKEDLEVFAIHHYLMINPGKYFNVFPVSDHMNCYLITPNHYELDTEFLHPPYIYNPLIPKIKVLELLGYYYVLKSPHYRFKGETHAHYELTYVDHGSMQIQVDDKIFTVEAHQMMIYGPGQFHNQEIPNENSCSFLTVVFDMDIDDPSPILNHVFSGTPVLHEILKKFTDESTNEKSYSHTMMLCLLEELMIELKRYRENGDEKPAVAIGTSTKHFQDEMLEKSLPTWKRI